MPLEIDSSNEFYDVDKLVNLEGDPRVVKVPEQSPIARKYNKKQLDQLLRSLSQKLIEG